MRVLLIASACVICGELALRAYNGFSPSFVFYDDSYNRFRSKPQVTVHGFVTNSRGFLDTEPSAEKVGRYRILGLGDSFAWGSVPYQQNYLTLLEDLLQARDPSCEVLNMGIPATGPPDYLALLVNEGLALEPNLVMISFFVGNDFTERQRAKTLYDHSYVAALLRYVFTLRPHFEGKPSVDSPYEDDKPTFDEAKFIGIEKRRATICTGPAEDFLPFLDESVEPLAKIERICARRGINLVVVMIPDEFQVSRELQAQLARPLRKQPTDIDWPRPNRLLVGRLDSLGIASIDLLPTFVQLAADERLYRVRDTHWNIRGNRIAAEAIAEALLAGDQPLLRRRQH